MKRLRCLSGPPGEQGSITPMVAFALVALVGAMALSIDLGQLFLVKGELQNVADAAALAGAKKLLQDKLPAGAPDGIPEVYCDEAIQAAIDTANKNFSFGASDGIKITAANVTIGKWNLATKQFDREGCSANPIDVNAVRVTVDRAGTDNVKVATFFGNMAGVGEQDTNPESGIKEGPAKLNVAAGSVAMLGLAGTSSVDVPFAIPYQYAAGGGNAKNDFQRILDRFGPTPAYAYDPRNPTEFVPTSTKWYDLGGYNPVDTNRAAFVVPTQGQQSNTYLIKYLKGPHFTGGLVFPQKKVGEQLWPMSEWAWGSYIKPTFQALQDRWNYELTNPKSVKVDGNWRVTVPVYKTTPVTSALPQNSWFKLASRLVPGVSQAYACTAYSPAVYTQGFATIDIVKVEVKSDCATSGDQVSNSNSCRNTCYVEIKMPLDKNTVSTDDGSNPIPFQKDYKDMNPAATKVGVFAAVPRIVK